MHIIECEPKDLKAGAGLFGVRWPDMRTFEGRPALARRAREMNRRGLTPAGLAQRENKIAAKLAQQRAVLQ